MQFAAVLQPALREQFRQAAEQARAWEEARRLSPDEAKVLGGRLRPFAHTTAPPTVRVAAADAGGAYPLLRHGGAAALFTVSAGARFAAGADGRPHEEPVPSPLLDLCWVPDGEGAAAAVEEAFERLGGVPLADVVETSDYRELKAGRGGARRLLAELIRPPAADPSNLGLQLRRVAELGEMLRLAEGARPGDWLLTGGTMSLPYVERPGPSLYPEHLLRLAAGRARERKALFGTLTGTHGLPLAHAAAHLADERFGEGGKPAEHWTLRLPVPGVDNWDCSLLPGTVLPPPGAVTYLVRFHAQEPVFRLDLDREAWLDRVGADPEGKERELFGGLDFYTHDLRAYGRPYPLFAAAARVHLSDGERAGLRRRLQTELAQAAGRPPAFPS